jgi:predicted nucleic acid-binding protein
MYLVDTSVLIDVLHGQQNAKTQLFEHLERQRIPYGITLYTHFKFVQEVGGDALKRKLTNRVIPAKRYWLPQTDAVCQAIAELYYRCHEAGINPRSSIGVLVVQTALHHDLMLLHNDSDFDRIKTVVDELRIAN